MNIKLTDPIKPMVKLLETMRKVMEKKLTAQAVNFLVTLLVVAIIILMSQAFVALLIIKVLEL